MSEIHETPFWLVWDPQGRAPTHKHQNEGLAQIEAERLARQNPGHQFYVLQPIMVVQRQDIVTKRFSRIPF